METQTIKLGSIVKLKRGKHKYMVTNIDSKLDEIWTINITKKTEGITILDLKEQNKSWEITK